MTPAYAIKLGFITQKSSIRAQKIDDFILVTYEIVIVEFLVQDKLGKVQFIEETILLADTSMKVVLGILFLIFSNTDIRFVEKELE